MRNAASTLVHLGAADPLAARLRRSSRRADVLEGEVAAGLDLQHLGDVDQAARRRDDAVRVVDHRNERVDALDLRGQQVVAGTAVDARVPRDAELEEQVDRAAADVGEEVVLGVSRRQAVVRSGLAVGRSG